MFSQTFFPVFFRPVILLALFLLFDVIGSLRRVKGSKGVNLVRWELDAFGIWSMSLLSLLYDSSLCHVRGRPLLVIVSHFLLSAH